MSLEPKKALVHRWLECVNQGNLDVVNELVTPTFVWHGPGEEVSGPDGMKQFIMRMRTAFPDLQMTFEDQFGEGDKVVTRYTARGTHNGPLPGIPPTGKQATFTGIFISHMAGGQIAEEWENFDQLGLLQQLGVISASGQAS